MLERSLGDKIFTLRELIACENVHRFLAPLSRVQKTLYLGI